MKKSLYCGASSVDITPKKEMLSNLRGLINTQYGDIRDNLNVRVIALSDGDNKALIVGFDLDKALDPEDHIEIISKRYGVPVENILYFGIHTHSAPIIGHRPGEPPMNTVEGNGPEVTETSVQYAKLVADAMYKAIDEATAGMKPAKMGAAKGNSYFNVNRNQDYVINDENGNEHIECDFGANFEGSVDHTVFVLRFDDMSGNPIAFLINYPMHNVVTWLNRSSNGIGLISGDLGGAVSRYTEERFPGCVALWSSGAAGDQNPIMMHELHYPDPITGATKTYIMEKGDPELLTVFAARHYADVVKVIKKIDCSTEQAEIGGVIEWSRTPGRKVERKPDGTVEVSTGEGVDPYEVRMQLLKVGDVAMMGIGGELLSSFGIQIKSVSPLENTIIINHNCSFLNPKAGYVLDDNLLSRPGRYANRSRIIAGYLTDSFEKYTKAMFENLMNKKGN